jgi:hypothetical protein
VACHQGVALLGVSGAFLALECAVGGLVEPVVVQFDSSVHTGMGVLFALFLILIYLVSGLS